MARCAIARKRGANTLTPERKNRRLGLEPSVRRRSAPSQLRSHGCGFALRLPAHWLTRPAETLP